MKYPTNLAKICLKNSINPILAGVYFRNGVAVASDAYKLVEVKTEGKVERIVNANNLKNGDGIEAADDGCVKITRKDGSALTARTTANVDEYPKYEILFEDAEKEEYTSVKISAKHLVDTLLAMQSDTVHIKISARTNAPMYITSNEARALIMPFTR